MMMMKACATYDDVNLILRLYEMRRNERLRDARKWYRREFRVDTIERFQELCAPGTDGNESFRMVTSYWDMAASFITGGVLQREIFFESGRELLLTWVLVKPVLPALRKMLGDPTYLANLEQVGGEFAAWLEGRAEGSFTAFEARVLGR